MRKGILKYVALVLSFLLIVPTAVLAAEGYVQDIGSWSDPTTGEIFKFVNAKSNDSVRQNQSVIYVVHTRIEKDAQTGKWAPKTNMERADAAASNGIWNGFMQGGFAGLAQGAGVATGMALLRPSTTTNNNGDGAGSSGNGAGASGAGAGAGNISLSNQQQQQQRSTNINRNTNRNSATGGAGGNGGAGGAGGVGGAVVNSGNNVGVGNATATANNAINAGAGGIGNIKAQGNSVVNTGQGMINTGNNAEIAGPLTQF